MGTHLLEFLKNKKTVSVCAFFAPSNSACFQCLSKKSRCDLYPIYQAHDITNAYFVLLLSVIAIFPLCLTYFDFFLSNGKQHLADSLLSHI